MALAFSTAGGSRLSALFHTSSHASSPRVAGIQNRLAEATQIDPQYPTDRVQMCTMQIQVAAVTMDEVVPRMLGLPSMLHPLVMASYNGTFSPAGKGGVVVSASVQQRSQHVGRLNLSTGQKSETERMPFYQSVTSTVVPFFNG